MSLSHDGFGFFSQPHGVIAPAGDFELSIVTGSFMGVLGESHLIDEPKGRNLICEITFQNYATHDLLKADLDTLAAKSGKLTGTLSITLAGNTTTYAKCTYVGVVIAPPGPFFDGSGVHGWVAFAALQWRQRNRS